MESASPERRRVLAEYEERMNRDLRLVADIVREFKRRGRRFTPANVIETFKHRQDNGMSVEIFSLQEEYA